MADGESSGSTERTIHSGLFPYGFKRELVALFKLAWPLSLSILFHYLIQPISLAFCGHLGKHQLAAVAMAISVIYITTVSFGRGLAFAGDTYFAQTYGSTNKKKMGVYLQKGLLFGVLTSCPIWAILLNTETILLLVGQDADVATMAQEYVLLFMPGVLAYCWLFLLMRYLLCQNRVIPNFIICVVACGVNALLHYGLLYQAKMGIKGSAIALMSSYYLVLFLFVAYIWGSGIYKETWDGWSWECLEDWGPFGKTTVASIGMTFIFWLCTEVGTFLGGILSERDLSTYSIMFQVEGFAWMLPLGLGGACAARVGQYLGSNEPLGALTATRVALTVQVISNFIVFGSVYGFKDYIPQIFTSNNISSVYQRWIWKVFLSLAMAGTAFALKDLIPKMFTSNAEIVAFTAKLFPILAIFLLLEGFGGVGVGIIRGTGRQTLGAIIIFISYYIFALPVGVPLMFATSLGLAGLWWGYVLGIGSQDLGLLAFILKVDWSQEADNAQIRAGTNKDDLLEDANERTSLLRGSVQTTEENGNYVAITSPMGQSRAQLLLSRLGVFLFFGAILAAGVLIRLYVKPYRVWTELCIPIENTTSIYDSLTTVQPENITLPYCNETVSTLQVKHIGFLPIIFYQ